MDGDFGKDVFQFDRVGPGRPVTNYKLIAINASLVKVNSQIARESVYEMPRLLHNVSIMMLTHILTYDQMSDVGLVLNLRQINDR